MEGSLKHITRVIKQKTVYLELFFVNGRAGGLLKAEVFNWAGHVLSTPRTKIAEALRRKDA